MATAECRTQSLGRQTGAGLKTEGFVYAGGPTARSFDLYGELKSESKPENLR